LFPTVISYLKYREVSGIQGLSANLFGQDLIFDAKLEPTPVPEAWLKRAGRYELIYPYKNTNLMAILNNGKSNLALKNGFLHAELLIFPWSGETIKFALKPVSDTEAVVMGVGRSRGDTISVIKQNNEELLCYGGVQYRLIK
jgi:hypothetical protein